MTHTWFSRDRLKLFSRTSKNNGARNDDRDFPDKGLIQIKGMLYSVYRSDGIAHKRRNFTGQIEFVPQ